MSKIEKNNDITVIIPVYNVDEKLFVNAITSLKEQFEKPQEVLIVVGDKTDDYELISKFDYEGLNVTILNHKESTSFASQMNIGVNACKTEWFSFVEQDDEVSKIWFKNVVEYREVYKEINVFLPIIVDIDNTGTFVGLSNQAAWAHTFSDELGVIDNESLLSNQNFNFGGMVMRKEVYQEFGGIKDKIKLTFMYEFLLRLTYNSTKIMIIPKFGYKHLNLRSGGLFESYRSELTPEESSWWLDTAKKEYFHTTDRDTKYEKIS